MWDHPATDSCHQGAEFCYRALLDPRFCDLDGHIHPMGAFGINADSYQQAQDKR